MSDVELQDVSFAQARRLKALGFDWPTHTYYGIHGDISTRKYSFLSNHNALSPMASSPTVALALKWCRDEKGVICGVLYNAARVTAGRNWFYSAFVNGDEKWAEGFSSYEEAESAMLDAVLGVLEKGALT